MLFDSTLQLRFWSKVYADEYGCWLWTAFTLRGYGKFHVRPRRMVIAHRLAYEDLVGPISDGFTIDHLCRIRPCVNPWHMESVTNQVNTRRGESPTARNARKELCSRGHSLSGANLVTRPSGRECRTCRNALKRKYRQQKRYAGKPA